MHNVISYCLANNPSCASFDAADHILSVESKGSRPYDDRVFEFRARYFYAKVNQPLNLRSVVSVSKPCCDSGLQDSH